MSYAIAQKNMGGFPYSITHRLSSPLSSVAPLASPLRYGYKINVNLTLNNSGEWIELDTGDRLWRLVVESKDALAISLEFNQFFIPEDAHLFIYNQDHSMILGAYTNANNQPDMYFSTSSIKGDIIYIEYYEPSSVYNEGLIQIDAVIHNYKDVFNLYESSRDESCGYNVCCDEATSYELQIKSTSFMSTGTHVCSGTLLNNTSENYALLLWTAWHCIANVDENNISNIRFYFNYETQNCDNTSAVYGDYLTGGILLSDSGGMNPDYALILLTDVSNISSTEDLCFSGWDASSSTPTIELGIHHPAGLPKKINFDDDLAITYSGAINWGDINEDGIVSDYEQSPTGTHRKVTWDTGGTAGGSSGSGLFNDNGLLVGQLSGGNNDCVDPATLSDCQIASNSNSCYEIVGCEWYNNQCVLATTTDFYGKFSHAFNDVSQWLDSANLGVTSLDGICSNCNTYDKCGVCDGPGLNEYGCCNDETIDCTGECGGTAVIDECGICDGNNQNQDCTGECGGSAELDDCGVCDGPGLNEYGCCNDETMDCTDNCGGTAVIDECGVCDGPGPEFECIDQYGFSKGLFCNEDLCDDYLLDSTDPIPTQLFLGQNYPNPFNPTTVIEYGIPTLSNTNISLYDLQGRKLQTLVNSIHRPGYYQISLTLNNLYSGIYIVKIVSDNATQIRKIALVK